MKSISLIIVSVALVSLSSGEILDNLEEIRNNQRWAPSGITNVQLVLAQPTYQQLTAHICIDGTTNCCFIPIQGNGNQIRINANGLCQNIRIGHQTRVTVQVYKDNQQGSFNNNQQKFAPKFFDIWLQNGAQLQSRYAGRMTTHTLAKETQIFWYPATRANNRANARGVQCPAPNQQPSCRAEDMHVNGYNAERNMICDFPCGVVSSLNPSSIGQGIRCYRTQQPQEHLQYCCATGQVNDIPACGGSNRNNNGNNGFQQYSNPAPNKWNQNPNPNNGYQNNSPNNGYRNNNPNNGLSNNSPNNGYRNNSPNNRYPNNSPNNGYQNNSPNNGYQNNSPNNGRSPRFNDY